MLQRLEVGPGACWEMDEMEYVDGKDKAGIRTLWFPGENRVKVHFRASAVRAEVLRSIS